MITDYQKNYIKKFLKYFGIYASVAFAGCVVLTLIFWGLLILMIFTSDLIGPGGGLMVLLLFIGLITACFVALDKVNEELKKETNYE